MLRVRIWVESVSMRRCFSFAMARWKLCASTTFEILPLSTCTVCEQKSCISNGIQPIFEYFASARRCWRWAFEWKVSLAQVFYFCNGEAKTLRIDNIWNFATFNLYTVPEKILYLQGYSTDFRNLCLSSTMLRGGHLGGKFQLRRYFTFAMARWKLCASTTFEILPLSTCSLCTAKIPYLQRYSTDFRNLCLSYDDVEGGHSGGKFHAAQVFYFCNGKFKTLRIDIIWNFATFNLYTVPAKTCISKGIQPIFEIFASARRCWRVAIWVESVSCAGILVLQWRGENFAHRQHLKVLPLSTCTVCQQKSCISKGIQPIFEIYASARKCWGWAFWWKVSCAHVVYCCNGKAKTLRIDNIWNFATFNLYTVPAKTYISKGIQPIFEIFESARRCWGWAFGWKVSAAQVFQFCNGEVKTLRIDNIWNFCHFQHVQNVTGKILYLQRYSANFRNLCLSDEDLESEAFGWNVSGAQVFYFCIRQCWKLCASTTFEILPPSTCSLCTAKILYLQRYSNDFRKLCLQLEDVEGGHLSGKFQVRRYFTFAMARGKLCASTTFEILPRSTCTVCTAKILYLQRYSTDFRNLCLSTTMLRVGIWVESFSCAGILLLQWQGENIAHRQHLKFCHFKPVQCASKNPISPKVFNRFSNSLPQLEDVEGGHFGGKLHVRRQFTAAMARRKLCASTTFEILPLSTWTLCQQKPVSPKVFNRFSKSLRQLEDVEGGHFGGKCQLRRYFSFAKARCKLCASTTFEVLPLSTCTVCQQKSCIPKGIQPIFEIFASARKCWGWPFGWKVSAA